MKRIYVFLAAAALILTGCAKELQGPKGLDGEMEEVTFTASLPTEMATKASFDNDGNGASVNRCIMEIYYEDDLFTRMYAPINEMKASFTTNVVSNRTYTVAFWADNVAIPTSESGLCDDNYYNTASLKAIALKGDYVGNLDARDAFFHCGSYTVEQGGAVFSDVKLKRPFAQVNVITSDLQVIKPVPALQPSEVNLTIKNAFTTFNAVTGAASVPQNLNYTASLYKFPETIGDKTDATLSMDYLFADSEKAVIDIDWKAKKNGNDDVAHSFAAVPYQRNYRTNIKGALLTTTGQWNVTVEPTWNNPDYIKNVVIANTLADAQGAVAYSSTPVTVIVSETAANNATEDDLATVGDKNYVKFILKSTSPTAVNFDLPAAPATVGSTNVEGWLVTYEANYPTETVAVNAPAGTKIKIEAPNSHVEVTGTTYAEITAKTAENTLVIPEGVTVQHLILEKGAVEIHGIVNDVTVNVTGNDKVLVRESENLNATVYEKLKNYIDSENGWCGKAKGTNPETYDIVMSNEWKYYTAKEFSQISGNTITIMNAAELALFAKNVNADVKYTGYTVELGADIDLSGHEWNPIVLDEDCATNLTIDGKSHKITGLTINREESNSGLFGNYFSHETVVKNIVISNPSVTQSLNQEKAAQEVGLNYTAALVAHMGCGVLKNCSVIGGSVSGEEQVGAIVGYLACGEVIECTVDGTVISGKNRVGGLAGKANTDSGYKINGNNIKATVSAGSTIGGVVGQIMGSSANYEIKNNKIDVPGVNCPIGELRAGQPEVFTSKLAENITGNTWTAATFDSDMYTYPGDQIIWNGNGPEPGAVAKVGSQFYNDFADAIAAVTPDSPMLWVSPTVWAADKKAYFNGDFYASLEGAIDAANTANADDAAKIYVRPGFKDVKADRKPIKTSMTIFGNNAELNQGWTPAVEYSVSGDPSYNPLNKNITFAIYNLHNGAGIWGDRCTDHVINAVMENCNNACEVLINGKVESGKNGVCNFTIKNCTFDRSKYAESVPVSTNYAGTISVDGCSFTGFNTDFAMNLNNKNSGHIEASIKNCTFTGCGKKNSSVPSDKNVLRFCGEVESTQNVTLDGLTFTDCADVAKVLFGKYSSGENNCSVSYSIKNTACSYMVITKGTTDVKASETITAADSPSGDNK